NGRFATTLLSDDVGQAGYYGQYPIAVAAPGAMPDPCEAANMANLRTAMGLPLQGYNNPAHPLPAPISGCIADANHVEGTDILVVRRGDSKVTALGSLTAADVYVQSNAADNDPADNTLKMRTVSLVEGIENFQVDYGVDTDGDGVLDGAYTQAPATINDWTNVVAVRLNVLARNIEPSNAADPKVYDMGLLGNEYAPGGNYKRHVY